MIRRFPIVYKDQLIEVEGGEGYAYVLKYDDGKFLMMDKDVFGWIVEDKSGDHWTDEDIDIIGRLIIINESKLTEEDLTGLPISKN